MLGSIQHFSWGQTHPVLITHTGTLASENLIPLALIHQQILLLTGLNLRAHMPDWNEDTCQGVQCALTNG